MLPKGIFLALFGVGIFILVQVAMPLVAYKTWEVFALDPNQLLADPHVGSLNYHGDKVLGISIENIHDFPAFIASLNDPRPKPYPAFNLSIPSLNLNDLTVKVDSNNFDETLAQLPGTAFPGEKGNLFITGHSSISEVFQISHQKALFIDLPKIKKGDQVLVQALGQQFTYIVEGLKVVNPQDISVIAPPDQEGRYLTLMTCVPPGFNTKRLIVLARLK